MSKIILGISAYYHDSSACLIQDGLILEAVHEERFTRKKHDSSFPSKSVEYILNQYGLSAEKLDAVVFYEKPYLKFERLLETYHEFSPKGFTSFSTAIPVWIKDKIFMTGSIQKEMQKYGDLPREKIFFTEHHLSHAASAFFPSPFEEAAILTLDGVGERATSIIGHGRNNGIKILRELHFPHSIGLFYSAFTYFCGFMVNSGEYKLMGLAPYGDPCSEKTAGYERLIKEKLVKIFDDGSMILNMEFFDYATGLKMINVKAWESLFGLKVKSGKFEYTQDYMDLSLAVQRVTEEIIMKMAAAAKELTGSNNLVMAGGVALNSVANGKILKSGLFENIWIQPASGDAGGSLGSALAQYYIGFGEKRTAKPNEFDSMKGAFLGPEFTDEQILTVLKRYGVKYQKITEFRDLCAECAVLLNQGKIIGWFQGRMEYGPRALGNRSILGDARRADMQKRMNLKIKFREGFRPFAPSVLEEDIKEYFDINIPSPYMLFVIPVTEKRRNPIPDGYYKRDLYDRLYHQRSDIPAVTHIDYSARIQSVNRETNPKYWTLINEFKKLTGYGVIVNTSFNVRGEPIVANPLDAFSCFMRTEMDYLVMGNYLVNKEEAAGIDKSDFSVVFGKD